MSKRKQYFLKEFSKIKTKNSQTKKEKRKAKNNPKSKQKKTFLFPFETNKQTNKQTTLLKGNWMQIKKINKRDLWQISDYFNTGILMIYTTH